jgi:hypothetical protein
MQQIKVVHAGRGISCPRFNKKRGNRTFYEHSNFFVFSLVCYLNLQTHCVKKHTLWNGRPIRSTTPFDQDIEKIVCEIASNNFLCLIDKENQPIAWFWEDIVIFQNIIKMCHLSFTTVLEILLSSNVLRNS